MLKSLSDSILSLGLLVVSVKSISSKQQGFGMVDVCVHVCVHVCVCVCVCVCVTDARNKQSYSSGKTTDQLTVTHMIVSHLIIVLT